MEKMYSKLKKRRVIQLYVQDKIWDEINLYCKTNGIALSEFVVSSMLISYFDKWRKNGK